MADKVLGLLLPISDQEIHDAMFHNANDKSSGLDGFPSDFSKIHRDVVGPSIIQAVKRFFLQVIF